MRGATLNACGKCRWLLTFVAGNKSEHMSKQHPESGRGSGDREQPGGQLEQGHSTDDEFPRTASGRRVTRKLGRPPVGKLEQVRLSDAERQTALELGDGILAKGVRAALNMVAAANNDPSKIKPVEDLDSVAVRLGLEDFAIAEALGEGNAAEGLKIALGVAQLLGHETARRMNPNGTGAARKRR